MEDNKVGFQGRYKNTYFLNQKERASSKTQLEFTGVSFTNLSK